MNNQNILLVIIGPTGIGKTALSISLATHYKCEIISCDSRQFYQEMKIGTAVPSNEELKQAPHHFIQNKSIFDNYTVGDFEKEALAKLDDLFLNNTIQILVGGSGLYVDAVLLGLDQFPEIDTNVREQVRADYESFGLDYLQQELKKLDSDYYIYLTLINPQTLQNPQRMQRFLEVCRSSALPYSSFLKLPKKQRNFTPIIIGLEADRFVMYNRINTRVDEMVKNGLLDEASKLHEYKNRNALQTVGYKELFAYLDSQCSLGEAIDEIKKNTRRFSKRQITWFKRTENVLWFDYATATDKVIETINNEIKKVLD